MAQNCRIEGCDRPIKCSELCGAHYQRWRKGLRGDDLAAPIHHRRKNRAEICKVDGCAKNAIAWDLCQMHYYRWRAWGHLGPAEPIRGALSECVIEGCAKKPQARGLCPMHYQRWRSTGETGGAEPYQAPNGAWEGQRCSVDDCDRAASAKGFCPTHYQRQRRGWDMDKPIRQLGKKRMVRSTGYAWVKVDGEWVLEHRHVVGKSIGRHLRPSENVHHLNGKRDDNRLENLELWVSSQPPGQRVADQVEWARELLSLYAPQVLAESIPIGQLTLL